MASSIFNASVSVTGTEPQFYKKIKDYILSLSDRITCAEDPDDEFDYSTKGDSHIATLNFSIDGVHVFKLYRDGVLRNNGSLVAVRSINFAMDIASGIPDGAHTLRFRPGWSYGEVIAQTTVAERGLNISHIINDDFVFLAFAAYTSDNFAEVRKVDTSRMIHTTSGSNVFVSASAGYPTSTWSKPTLFDLSGFTLYDKAGVLPQGTFLSRFTYAVPPGQIDYIKSSIYQNGGSKMFENTAIYDSTTVTVGSTVSLKDGAYVAIGAHQLVKCS
ncbi:MAG: hypothetical protein IJ880_03375 [Bacilli bacterium]|nr:hypothetical protein [Bacilli bacterium]